MAPRSTLRSGTVPVLICNNPLLIADFFFDGIAASSHGHAFYCTFKKGADPDLFPKISATELPGVKIEPLRGLRRLARRNWRFKQPA